MRYRNSRLWTAGLYGLLMGGMLTTGQESVQPKQSDPAKRKIYTNEDLEKLQPPARKTKEQSAPGVSRDPLPGKTPGGTLENFKDMNGHGREYWRPKSQALRKRLAEIEDEIARTEQRLKEARSVKGVRVTRQGNYRISSEGQSLMRRLDQRKRERDAILADLAALEEEARKAGALPEWLR